MKRFLIVITLLLIVLLPVMSSAAVPRMISYQGLLTDSGGVKLTGTYNFTFKIYNQSSGGVALWTESQTSISVNDGIYNIMLGSVTPIDVDFSETYWLGVTVGTDPEMTPRIQMASVPYALKVDDDTSSSSGLSFYEDTFSLANIIKTLAFGETYGVEQNITFNPPSDNFKIIDFVLECNFQVDTTIGQGREVTMFYITDPNRENGTVFTNTETFDSGLLKNVMKYYYNGGGQFWRRDNYKIDPSVSHSLSIVGGNSDMQNDLYYSTASVGLKFGYYAYNADSPINISITNIKVKVRAICW